MLRISSTTLEQFRRVLQEDYATEEELVASVKGQPFVPRWQMLAGSAWHKLLETGIGDVVDLAIPPPEKVMKSGDYYFSRDAVQDAREYIGTGIWEVKGTQVIEGAEIVAQVDHVRGLYIQDQKTKFSSAHAGDYEHSLQWRLYLQIHGAAAMTYNLWSFREPDGGGFCDFKEVVSFRFWSYPGLEDDCRRWVREFLGWAESKGLTDYLRRDGSSPSLRSAA